MIINPKTNIAPAEAREYELDFSDSIRYPYGAYFNYFIEKNYRSYNFVGCDIILPEDEFLAGQTYNIPIILKNTQSEPVDFHDARPAKVFLTYLLLQYGKPVIYKKFEDISELTIADEYSTSLTIKMPEKPGVYYLKVSIKSGWLPPGINSRLVKVRVE
jgi:hypothetical protein